MRTWLRQSVVSAIIRDYFAQQDATVNFMMFAEEDIEGGPIGVLMDHSGSVTLPDATEFEDPVDAVGPSTTINVL